MTTQTISLTDEPRLSDLVDRANEFLERFILTREGKAEAVLLSAEDFDGLLETLEILSDTELVKRLAEAEEELARGGGHSLAEVRERIRRGHDPAFESS
ncbi:MAG TPA: type II toxin-antitoxin system Phd/YefM family antitoxin [Thermoanaerobaculia bacterium]|nr:type II toxin-antitoxin system Phd/YefM family antitoxin [Thermoanaerobaculia bacterium]